MISHLIFGIHCALFLMALVVPFLKDKRFLVMYSLIIPFLLFHWSVNDDTCALTQLECYFTDTPKERTFMGRLVGPIYNMSDDMIGKILKSVFFSLWLIVQYRLGHYKLRV